MAKQRGGLGDPRVRHDAFFRKARAEGFAARSVYKLDEIDRRVRLLRPGDRVLDLGCCPGSWLQYATKAVGPHGAVVGIDRNPLPRAVAGARVRVIVGDVFTATDADLLGPLKAFDVVLSDMAPDTTGIRSADQARSAALFPRPSRARSGCWRRAARSSENYFKVPISRTSASDSPPDSPP